jgi:hypothetical protein
VTGSLREWPIWKYCRFLQRELQHEFTISYKNEFGIIQIFIPDVSNSNLVQDTDSS